ncbi:hypothetical protein AVEN_115301-1 [Araneus ventricosus]|uniref:Uncharacterized protein n=1 Tax=Araneus ventricosus TaxID=182803 RepID=A0A4Y1ZYU4_ARAVE|nr:hypothetical protein AVEN_115301-1 [Araneus ventricosus]
MITISITPSRSIAHPAKQTPQNKSTETHAKQTALRAFRVWSSHKEVRPDIVDGAVNHPQYHYWAGKGANTCLLTWQIIIVVLEGPSVG